jgi:hypothetical protein
MGALAQIRHPSTGIAFRRGDLHTQRKAMIATATMFPTSAIPGRPYLPGERRPQPAAARRVVTAAELLESVNHQLATRGDCEGLVLEADALRVGLPDPDGCNWNSSALRVRVAHGSSTRALGCVRQVVEWARLNLELAEPFG